MKCNKGGPFKQRLRIDREEHVQERDELELLHRTEDQPDDRRGRSHRRNFWAKREIQNSVEW